ncbi:transcriptional regulator [Candidatus Shapirobacteria bacterium CG_4_9_14_0_2_um_filter_39_11]|uniref:Transcriptional regulator n=1 Tax=Candidatus Shapirobacteria bacterium CG_4_9_14_0_2_um_filter_39_11 TaxID=1974478 RepID=A0A2M8ETI8_9BACT|nr:MAG: transcriptional regulator [Candidatus Shapirobacteria bacterium CG_4_9_14_0_2_um_filter_39_11]
MRRKHLDFEQYKKEVFLKDPEVKVEYDRLQPEFAVIEAILRARLKRGVTQKKLAQRLKTKQSAISRLESGTANPSLNFLKRLAEALDSRLEIKLVPK